MFLSKADLEELTHLEDPDMIAAIISVRFWNWYDEHRFDFVTNKCLGLSIVRVKDFKDIFTEMFGLPV